MKLTTLAFTLLPLLLALADPALPQRAEQSNAQVEAARQMIREGARQFIDEELMLTDEQAAKFWPLYETYRRDVIAIEDEYVELIRDFVQKYDRYALTDDDADAMIDRYFDIKVRVLQKRHQYAPQFREILPGTMVMRMYQLENKVQAEVDATLALLIPLADPS